jgi:hypothetical protein
MNLREREWVSMDWIRLVQDRDRRRALVNTEMNHKMFKSSCVAAQLSASQGGLLSIRLQFLTGMNTMYHHVN